jgi:predicted amidohydrolase
MSDENVRFALAQCSSVTGDETTDPRPANLHTAIVTIKDAAARDARVVVFGELFLTGARTDQWLTKWAVRTDDPNDPTLTALSVECARHDVTVIVGTSTVDDADVCHNSVVLIGPDGRRRLYHKRHLAHIRLPDGYEAEESRFYRPGDLDPVFDMGWGTIGLQICYEVTFPEVARCAMLAGADIVLNCTASLSGTEDVWSAMARARAFENGVFFLVCSVVGDQGTDTYFGGSAAYDPHGVRIAQAAPHRTELLIVDIGIGTSRRTRQEMNIVDARRPDLYTTLTVENP